MSKFIDNLKAKNEKAIKKELERLHTLLKDAKEFYADTGYDKYFKKINRIESEIQEIETFQNIKPEISIFNVTKEKEYLDMLRKIKAKWQYLKFDIPVTVESNRIDEILMDVKL